MKKPIFLIGMPCSGKTYAAKHLSQIYNRPYADTDELIYNAFLNQHSKVKVNSLDEVFYFLGHNKFRLLEREILHNHVPESANIIACGGGLPCYFDNIDVLKIRGVVVFLDTDLSLIGKRLIKRKQHPVINFESEKTIESVKQVYFNRLNFYNKAKHKFDNLEDLEAWAANQK